MFSFINKHTLLSPSQYNFRLYKNTTDAVVALVNFVTGKLEIHSYVGALFMDEAKTFNSIDHSIT